MKALLFSSLIFSFLLFTSCDEETIRPLGSTEEVLVDIENFSGLFVSHSFDVRVAFTGTENVRIIADENFIPFIEVFKDGNILAIRVNEDVQFQGNYKLEAEVDAKFLDKFYASGASSIILQDPLNVEGVFIELSGASRFTGEVEAINAEARISGASIADLSGNSEFYDLQLSGASTSRDYDFEVDFFVGDISGASQCRITVNEEIRIRASGASSLRYRGDAEIIEQDVSGESSVERD